jgi:hypothetical protein
MVIGHEPVRQLGLRVGVHPIADGTGGHPARRNRRRTVPPNCEPRIFVRNPVWGDAKCWQNDWTDTLVWLLYKVNNDHAVARP